MNTETRGPEYADETGLLPDLIVLRHAPHVAYWLRAAEVEGRWWDLKGVALTTIRCPLTDGSVAVAHPSGRFEVDGRGRVAEIWELNPSPPAT